MKSSFKPLKPVRLVRLFISLLLVLSSSAIFQQQQAVAIVPPARGTVVSVYNPISNMTTTTYTFRLAYIASEVTPVIQLLAEHQRAVVAQNIATNVLQIQSSGNSITTLVAGNTTTIINVTTSVLPLRAVLNANVLFEEGIMHTTFSDGLNVAIIEEAPNITFTTFQQPTNNNTIEDYPNMEVVLLPIQQVAFEAGLLGSAIVFRSFTIAIMYAHYYRDAINGLRNAVQQACPLCYVKAFGVCSGSFECPGQWDRFIAFAGNADVVITGAHVSDLLPSMVFRFNKYNATELGLPKKYVIIIGDVLNNIGSAVKSNPYFMGVLRIQLDSSLSNLVEGLVYNNFSATIITAPSAWDRSFTNASINPGVTQNHLSEFILNAQLFDWGMFTPVYDAIDKATEDSERIGGLPFVPIGDILTGFNQNIKKWSTAVAVPSISDNTAATCELYDRYVVISSDLQYVSVISTQQAWAKQIPLRISDMSFAEGANNSKLSSYYDYSLRPIANATARVRMICSMIPDSTYGNPNVWMLNGGVYLNATTGLPMNAETNQNAVVHETLRLRLVCLDPYSIWCDFFVLENMTSLVTASPINNAHAFWHDSPSGIGAKLLSPRGVAATTSNVSFLLQNYDSLSTATIITSGVWMGVVERPDVITVTNAIRVLPPVAFANTDVALFRPVNISWSTTLRGMLAIDLRRRVMVFLPVMDLVLPGAIPLPVSSPWWGMNGSSAAPASIRWLDYSTTIPVTITVTDNTITETLPCTFKSFVYLSSLDRLAIVLRASYLNTNPGALIGDYANPTDVLSVYHYSSVLQQWVLQSSMKIFRTAAGTQDYAVLPLQDLLGGGWMLYPTLPSSYLFGTAMIVYRVSSLNTFTACDSSRGFAISPNGASCYVCAGGQVATVDGFCADVISNSNTCEECDWVIPLAAVVGACIVIVLVVMLLRYLYLTRWSQKARVAILRERSTKFANAPPSGRTPILTLMIVDADVLWQTGGENLLEAEYGDDEEHRNTRTEDDTSSYSSGTSGNSSERNSKGKRQQREKASTEFVLRILDRLYESLCSSIAANNGYLAEYRGEVAVVVHNNPAALMCIALEASLAMAQHRPPVRLAIGLHIGNVVRTVDLYGTKKCVFVGDGVNVAARIAPLSATGFVSGGWMASQQFVNKVMDESPGVMKALALSRGVTSQIRYENIITDVQEITSAMLVDALGDQTAFDLARQRRSQQLKERRKNTKAANIVAKKAEVESHNTNAGGGGGGPRTVYASKVRHNNNSVASHSGGETHVFDVPDAPPPRNPATTQANAENPFLPPPQQQHSTPLMSPLSMELSSGAPNGIPSLFAAGGTSATVITVTPHDPPPLPLQPFLAPAHVTSPSVAPAGNGTSPGEGGGASSLKRTLSMTAPPHPDNLPPSKKEMRDFDAAEKSLPPIGGRGAAGGMMSESSGSPVFKPRGKFGSQFAAASPMPSNVRDESSSPIHGRMSDSRSSTRLSLNEAEQLEAFAAQIGRVLLSQLPTASVDILVNRLHLPNFRKNHNTGKYPAVVPKASLRHFSQRIVAMTNTDLGTTLSNTRTALALDTNSHNTSARSGITIGNSRGDAFSSVGNGGGSANAMVAIARFESLANQSQTPNPVLPPMGNSLFTSTSATLLAEEASA